MSKYLTQNSSDLRPNFCFRKLKKFAAEKKKKKNMLNFFFKWSKLTFKNLVMFRRKLSEDKKRAEEAMQQQTSQTDRNSSNSFSKLRDQNLWNRFDRNTVKFPEFLLNIFDLANYAISNKLWLIWWRENRTLFIFNTIS